MKTEKQFIALAENSWLRPDEKLQRYGGGDRVRMHIGATIAGHHEAPHRPRRPVSHSVDLSDALVPTAAVRQGHFHDDEWVHDPTMRGWVCADAPDRIAVECADALVAAGPEAWFVGTDQRLAIVVDAAAGGQEQRTGATAPDADGGGNGFGRLLGKARSAVSAVAELSDSLMGAGDLVTLWECSREHLVTMTGGLKGKSIEGLPFSRNRFSDGSVIEVATQVHLKGFR